MKTIGFVGASGTGKSHRASWVARERGIDYIIDDGLFIRVNQVLAGTSAKKEKTRIASIKHALFTDEKHANEVMEAIRANKTQRHNDTWTSTACEANCTKAAAAEISQIIYIEDVADEFEIQQAVATRREQGKHVIPVPTFEIKRTFQGIFLIPYRYSGAKGRLIISWTVKNLLSGQPSAILGAIPYLIIQSIQIVEYVVTNMEGVNKISRFRAENHDEGITIEMELVLVYGIIFESLFRKYRRRSVRKWRG